MWDHHISWKLKLQKFYGRDRFKTVVCVTPSLICKKSQRAPYHFVAGLSRAISCQDGRSAEFSFFSTIGLKFGSSSCAFWIKRLKEKKSVVVTTITVFIPNFFLAFEQCLQLSLHGLRDRESIFQ
ncbi:hypothetical protein AVEN_113003-1 [Araneus ventricosus]|uniref:Uncharacterized protein n=1 Tax=Araneus ventricosus TaxID=182803 RepID=A0A4Y2LB18_ARAVE|nr:hypothetical protein AVEN_113003-1 [Araneus ventricosus]